eukprot:TRINITY_DN4231_c0_g1_i1.p1 TRINITY_DN4231_c0_g1~~TRINITY_DN4231_c0_g1_i1.p1  ORF type:complete len:771 (+),score=117.67 TRINITY_DN4231_c0_g1_i1:1478-3790(+)
MSSLLQSTCSYRFGMILDESDPGARQIEAAARFVTNEVNRAGSRLFDAGQTLDLDIAWLGPRVISNPLQDVEIAAQIVGENTLLASEGAASTRRLPAYILANSSIPFFSFDSSIIAIAPHGFTVDFAPSVWTDHAFALVATLNLSRVSVAYSFGSSAPALAFINGAASRGIKVERRFVIGSSPDGIIGELRHARDIGAVYFILFGGSSAAFNVMSLAAANDLYFEFIWVTTENSGVAMPRFLELWEQSPIDPQMVNGFMYLAVNRTAEYPKLMQEDLPAFNSTLFLDIDERIPYFVDAVRGSAISIAAMLEAGLDPSNEVAMFQFLINETLQGNPITGDMKWLPNGLRGGTLGIRNWFLPRSQASNGTIIFSSSPSIATLGYCGLNVCTIPDPAAYQWSASDPSPSGFGWTMPNQDHNRVLKIGMASLMSLPMAKQWYSSVRWAVQVANSEVMSFYQLRLDLVTLSTIPMQSVAILEDYKLRSDPVAVVGPLFSFTAKAVASTLQASAIPMVSPAATDEALSNNFYYENVNRVGDSNSEIAISTMLMMRQFGWFAFCALSSTDDNPAIDEFARHLPPNMKIVARAAFPLYGMSDLDQKAISEALEKIKNSEARIIVYSAHPTSLRTVLRLAKEKNMFGISSTYIWIFDKQIRYLSLTPDNEAALAPLTLEEFQGVFMVAPRQRPSGSMLPTDCFPRLQKFLAPSPAANASSITPLFLTAHWVDSINLVARAIESLYQRYGDRARDGHLLNDEIRKVAFIGCTGVVAFNAY